MNPSRHNPSFTGCLLRARSPPSTACIRQDHTLCKHALISSMYISSLRPCLTKSPLSFLRLRIGASIQRGHGEQRGGGFGIIEDGYLISISGIRCNWASIKSFFNSISRRARRPQWACRIGRLWGREREGDRDRGLEGSACVAYS